MEYLIISYRSRTETMGFYKFLNANGIGAEIVNTPKEANVGCGLSVKVTKSFYNYLRRAILTFNGKSFAGVFLVTLKNNKKMVRPV